MATFRVQVENWTFWSPESRDPVQWLEHWKTSVGADREGVLDASVIPPAQRRRASRLSKMALSTAIEVLADQSVDCSVFCSQHGEIVRTTEILSSMVRGVEISPTAFSQSVHNTGSGMFTIISGSHAPSTSIAAGAATFAAGWLEVQAHLASRPDDRVLLVDCDEALPEVYRRYSRQVQSDHVLALILGSNRHNGIALRQTAPGKADLLPLGPQFLAWLQSEESELFLTAEEQGWLWSR